MRNNPFVLLLVGSP